MLQFIPQWSCWKVNQYQVLVIASCAKTHEVVVYIANDSGSFHELPAESKMPDVRRLVPCRWHALSAIQRANIRGAFAQDLAQKYGDEDFEIRRWAREVGR